MDIQPFLEKSSAHHTHLCPRQVLGVRIGLLAARLFGCPPGENPQKRMLTILESDGCFADGVQAATGCGLGHRTLRLEDYGKIAAVFVDTRGIARSLRIAPQADVREQASQCMPLENRHYFAQLEAYKIMPDENLLSVEYVSLVACVEKLVSRPGVRVRCERCGEDIINEREVLRDGALLCRTCAGEGYYRSELFPAADFIIQPACYLNAK